MPERKDEQDIPSGAWQRSMKLGALPLSFAGRAAVGWGQRMVGGDADEIALRVIEKNADQLFAVLGELKGGAMKLGQALSVYEAAIPAEFAEPYQKALTKLQSQAPPLPAARVHRVLDEQFGRSWRQRFAHFDDTPAAAASIGQVHRATWSDGRDVAVKIQYPGADLAIEADLKQLDRFARLAPAIVPGLDTKALIKEIRDSVREELDYRKEADHQRAFHAEFADSDVVHVPAVVASAPKVIVSEWIEGERMSTLIHQTGITPDQQLERDRIARVTLELLYSSPARVGLMHGDPHPGNFMVLPDGRIGVIDFGSCAVLPNGIPRVLGQISRYAADGDADMAMNLLKRARFVVGDLSPEEVFAQLGGLIDPLREEEFHFRREWLAGHGERLATQTLSDREMLKTGRALNLPPEYMIVLRVTGGWTAIFCQLDCTIPARSIAMTWVPGFADPADG
jgi:predicted unusual protein kinase regulating ubiquinone biosynthesis (AarF/ABC1/UbiB family)